MTPELLLIRMCSQTRPDYYGTILFLLLDLNQTSQLDSHPGSHSIKQVNEPAILAATQSNQSTGQPSWQSLNQTRQLDSHPGSHSIKPASESWRPVGRLEGGVCRPPRKYQVTAA